MRQLLIRRPVGKAPSPNRATQAVPFETLESLYQEVKDRLDAVGVDWDNANFNTPGYNEVKDRLNETWLKCLEGRASVEDFKEALAQYEEVVLADTGPRVETQGGLF